MSKKRSSEIFADEEFFSKKSGQKVFALCAVVNSA